MDWLRREMTRVETADRLGSTRVPLRQIDQISNTASRRSRPPVVDDCGARDSMQTWLRREVQWAEQAEQHDVPEPQPKPLVHARTPSRTDGVSSQASTTPSPPSSVPSSPQLRPHPLPYAVTDRSRLQEWLRRQVLLVELTEESWLIGRSLGQIPDGWPPGCASGIAVNDSCRLEAERA